MGARMYDPYLNRFISPDTIIPDPKNPQNLNRYTYCLNNPLNYLDVDGHIPWQVRYGFMQGWMTSMSMMSATPMTVVGPPLLHGRRDVQNNQTTIQQLATSYQDVESIVVAAAIAEQASDYERLYGMDLPEKLVRNVPGHENMSMGIAQLKPTELEGLGLAGQDPFDPAVAIQGMYAKVNAANNRINELDPTGSLASTDRYMLLALAQNSGSGVIDTFFGKAEKTWSTMLGYENYATILRYYTLHLDWFLLMGWELPEGVDMDTWRKLVFSDIEGHD